MIQPGRNILRLAGVEDVRGRKSGLCCDGAGEGIEFQMMRGVGVRGQKELTSGFGSHGRKGEVEILPPRESVNLDGDTLLRAGGKDLGPTRLEARSLMKMAAPGMGENIDPRGGDGSQQALGLVSVGIEGPMNRNQDTIKLFPFRSRKVKTTVLEDLDLKTLEKVEVILHSMIEAANSPTLEADAFEIQSGGDLQGP